LSNLSCRLCGAELEQVFVDLGVSPLANAYLQPVDLSRMEPFYPLTVYVCAACRLVQLPAVQRPEEMFSEYAYFSSYSESWLRHAEAYVDEMITRFALNGQSHVVEIASNDGYLLQYFKARGVPVLGIEPAGNVARVAQEAGIPTLVEFFGAATARELAATRERPDLIVGNNVLAHVPALNDFIHGLKLLLAPDGVVTMEFPHLLRLMAENQFDTIYHEHLSYFSLLAVEYAFSQHGLDLFDVEELPTHGGSLRIYARHARVGTHSARARVRDLRARELKAGLDQMDTYTGFGRQVAETKRALLAFLIREKSAGKTVVGYGAPAKGNTLLNYCGIRTDFLDYTVDRSPHKQGWLLPGTRIPIYEPERIAETRPDYVLILPWNLKDEIIGQMAHIRDWGGKFVVSIPSVEVIG
jgi:SAM-dependent methyltransferase